MWNELRAIMETTSLDPSVRAVVVSSTSDKLLTAGLDRAPRFLLPLPSPFCADGSPIRSGKYTYPTPARPCSIGIRAEPASQSESASNVGPVIPFPSLPPACPMLHASSPSLGQRTDIRNSKKPSARLRNAANPSSSPCMAHAWVWPLTLPRRAT